MNLRPVDPNIVPGVLACMESVHLLPSHEPGGDLVELRLNPADPPAMTRLLNLKRYGATLVSSPVMPAPLIGRAEALTGRRFRAEHKSGWTWIIERTA